MDGFDNISEDELAKLLVDSDEEQILDNSNLSGNFVEAPPAPKQDRILSQAEIDALLASLAGNN